MSKKHSKTISQPASPTLLHRLFRPVDIASIVYFRIGFGTIMLWEVWRAYTAGWIQTYWAPDQFHFTYFGFDWVRPWPGDGMYYHLLALGILAVFIICGIFYRISAALFFLGFTYIFLLEQARYLNHLYFVCLVSFLMIFIPAHRAFSLDVWKRKSIRSATAPAWALWILRAQMGIVYFFGGVAKINGDWLRGEPIRDWLGSRTDFPVIGQFFTEEWMVYLFAYGGMCFDLFIVPLLLWRKTRPVAFLFAVLFHVTNSQLFGIGIFPWFSIAATAIFFEPDWPRRLLRLKSSSANGSDVKMPQKKGKQIPQEAVPLDVRQRATAAFLGVYVSIQLLMPLRHFLYPGNVSWTEEGHNFAWHMKLRDKDSTAEFLVTDLEDDITWPVSPHSYLNARQVSKMSTRPDMILNFAHFLAEKQRERGLKRIEIRANVMASLNGRNPQPLIDPTVDLTTQRLSLLPAKWIVPLREPLQPGKRSPNKRPITDPDFVDP